MKLRTVRVARGVSALGALLALALPACSSAPDGDGATSTEDAIFGGFPAANPKLDAVGSIIENFTDTATGLSQKCSGTLIGPHTVLTAAHCAEKIKGKTSLHYTEHSFRMGPDSAKPTHDIRIVGSYVGPLYAGGTIDRGADIGLMFLAEDVTDVTPIPASTVALTGADVGKSFLLVGYGQLAPTEAVGPFNPRQMASVKLAPLTGDPMHYVWSSPADLSTWLKSNLGINVSAASLTGFYNSPLHPLIDGQGFFTSNHNGGQGGLGDSGSPMIRIVAGQPTEVVAVNSAYWSINLAGGIQTYFGGSYAGLTAFQANADFIAQKGADDCRGVPAGGACSGDTAIQCNPKGSFVQPITTMDCRDFGQWCGTDASGAATCVDPTPPPAPNACAFPGTFVSGSKTVYDFQAGGALVVAGQPRGLYTYADGNLEMDDTTGVCNGMAGTYRLDFSADCTQFTLRLVHDVCRARGESFDLGVFKRQ